MVIVEPVIEINTLLPAHPATTVPVALLTNTEVGSAHWREEARVVTVCVEPDVEMEITPPSAHAAISAPVTVFHATLIGFGHCADEATVATAEPYVDELIDRTPPP